MKIMILLFLISLNLVASVSSDLIFLEENNAERVKWINLEQSKFLKKYNSMTIHHEITNELRKIDDVPYLQAKYQTKNNEVIEVIQTGYGKELILNINGVKVFGSFNLSKNGLFQFNSMHVSPNEKFLSLSFFERGNTEDFNFLLFNLETHEMIFQRRLFSNEESCFFISDSHCLINSPDKRNGDEHLIEYDLLNLIENEIKTYESFEGGELFSLVKLKDEEKNLVLYPNGKKYLDDGQSLSANIAFAKDGNIIYQAYNLFADNMTKLKIEKVELSETEMPKTSTIKIFDNEIKYQLIKSGNGIGVISTWGLDRKLRILNLAGDVLVEEMLPNDFRYTISNIDLENKTYSVTIAAGDKKEIRKISFNDSDLLPKTNLWSFQDLNLEVKNYMVKSIDGTMIPYQTIGIKNYSENLRHAFIQAYGGFNISGYLFSYRGLEQYYPFLKRGGIIVNTGVRGGNEYGTNWNLAAKKDKKMKTFEDIDAVALDLIEKGLSKKEWISLFGSSNGGYTTATTGLLFSEHFGLIIPHAGVHDQLHKKVMDKDFNGWVREYLDEDKVGEKEKIPEISPVELALNESNIPFLILAEQNDTRVNPAHSYKLYYQLSKTNKAATYLYSMKNYGHFTQSYPVGYLASARLWSIIWSTIFDSQI